MILAPSLLHAASVDEFLRRRVPLVYMLGREQTAQTMAVAACFFFFWAVAPFLFPNFGVPWAWRSSSAAC
jgi:hypothetical protein